MQANVYKRKTCRLCGDQNIKLVVPLEPIPIAEKYLTEDQLDGENYLYGIDLYMCEACGHVQIIDVIDPSVLWSANFTFRSGQAQIIIDHLFDVAAKICRNYDIEQNSFVIDVGSNDGTLLKGFKKQGMRVLGIDPAETIATESIAGGIPTVIDFLTYESAQAITEEHGKAQVVCCFNTFAHADDLTQLAGSIESLLSPEGIFVFEVSYLVSIIDDMLIGTIIHEHLSHHSAKPLATFLDKNGMELVHVERNAFQGGSLIGVAQKMGGSREVQPCVSELIQYEIDNGYDKPTSVRTLTDRLADLRKDMSVYMSQWNREGAVIAGYGAARSGPTLIAQLKIGKAISFIVDDHPEKVGRYTPGDHIKVLPTKELLERMPDHTLVLAWIHARTIIGNNLEYLDRGGNFVICLPEVRLIDQTNVEAYLSQGPI